MKGINEKFTDNTLCSNAKPFIFILLCLSLSVLLAACSGVPTPTEPASETANQEAANQETANQEEEPGTAEFGLTEAELAERVESVEGAIAECMTEAGFEYIPVDYPTVRKAMESIESAVGLSADEYRAQYGFGITIQPASAESPASMGLGEQNIRTINGLSATDLMAYNRTLFGDNPDQTFMIALDAEDFSKIGGCTRSAVEKFFDEEDLGATFKNPKDERVEQDPRMIEATKNWSDCMRTAGYPYASSKEIDTDLARRLDEIIAGADPAALSEAGKAALSELQGEELAIAAADHECHTEFVLEIRRQVETEVFGAPLD